MVFLHFSIFPIVVTILQLGALEPRNIFLLPQIATNRKLPWGRLFRS